MRKRYYVEKIDNLNTLENGKRITWGVFDRQSKSLNETPLCVGDYDRRDDARAEASRLNAPAPKVEARSVTTTDDWGRKVVVGGHGSVGRPTSAWDCLKPEFRSEHEGWSTRGEFHCPRCYVILGKNLKNESPFALAATHLQEHAIEDARRERLAALAKLVAKEHGVQLVEVANAEAAHDKILVLVHGLHGTILGVFRADGEHVLRVRDRDIMLGEELPGYPFPVDEAAVIAAGQRRHEEAVRADLEARYGRVWTTDELSAEFTVEGFGAPFVVVTRKSDGKRGSLEFTHRPRFYFHWQEA